MFKTKIWYKWSAVHTLPNFNFPFYILYLVAGAPGSLAVRMIMIIRHAQEDLSMAPAVAGRTPGKTGG